MKSIHVLVPQAEEMVRNLLALIGVPIYKNVKEQPGVVDVKSCPELGQPKSRQAMGFRR